MGKMREWFSGLSKAGKVGVASAALILGAGTVNGLASPQTPTTQPQPQIQPTKVKQSKIEVKTVTTTEAIPFTTTTINDPNLDIGQSRVQTDGVDGVLTHTYQVTYTNDVETSRTGPVDSITTQPVTKVITQGAHQPAPSCPNGTYINTYGATVCRPYESSSVPAGASAQCVDGTYSFSQSRRGTCSSHGGVAVWY